MSQTADALIKKYGVMLTQAQLAEVLHRSLGGLRWSLSQHQTDPQVRRLREMECRIGRRKYYPAVKVAALIEGGFE